MLAHDNKLTIPAELQNALHGSVQTLVVGIGSPHAGDSIGWQLADCIAQQKLSGVVVRRALVPFDLLDWLEDFAVIHLIDAMQSPMSEHSVRCWHWPDCTQLATSTTTSHSFDIISVLQLASALGKTKANIYIWGIPN